MSSRRYALAAYSRFIRPGAVRIGVDTTNAAVTTTVDMERVTAYVTDSTHNIEEVPGVAVRRGPHTTVNLAPRSLTTLVSQHPGQG